MTYDTKTIDRLIEALSLTLSKKKIEERPFLVVGDKEYTRPSRECSLEIYSLYVLIYRLINKKWMTPEKMGVANDTYSKIINYANAFWRKYDKPIENIYPLPVDLSSNYIFIVNCLIPLDDFIFDLVAKEMLPAEANVIGARLDLNCKEDEEISEDTELTTKKVLEWLSERENEYNELSWKYNNLQEKYKYQEEHIEEMASNHLNQVISKTYIEVLEKARDFAKKKCGKSDSHIVRDLLHEILPHEYKETISNIGDASEEEWDELIDSIRHIKINIERVNDIHDNDHVEAGL